MKEVHESWEDYLYNRQRPGCYARLFGHEAFVELYEKKIIVPYVTAIRIMYSGAIDIIYMVNEKGRLVNIRNNDVMDETIQGENPADILNLEKAPSGWEVEGIRPKGFEQRYPKGD